MWQNQKFILLVSYCVMLNTPLETLNFGKSVQTGFQKKWRAGAFPGEGSCCTAFLTEDRIRTGVLTYVASL